MLFYNNQINGDKMGLFSVFKKTTVLYFPGCITYFKFKDNFEIYKRIFDRLGIEYKTIDKKICCGIPATEAGYETEARKLAKRNNEIFKEEEITSIITNSPCCYKMFMQDYPKILPDWNIEPKNIWRIILTKLQTKPNLIKKKDNGFEITAYQDSCYLGRYCEIYDEPREILKLLGYSLKEIPNSKSEAICCGSCGGLPTTNPQLADDIAKERLMQAKRFGIKKIIVASLQDYELLKKNSEETGIKISELGEVIAEALGIIKRKYDETNMESSFNKETELAIQESEEKEIFEDAKASSRIQEELNEEDYYNKQRENENGSN